MIEWNQLIFGSFSPQQVKWAVSDSWWQDIRISMIGEPIEKKYDILTRYLSQQRYSQKAKIQVTNYVNALKRGGQL